MQGVGALVTSALPTAPGDPGDPVDLVDLVDAVIGLDELELHTSPV